MKMQVRGRSCALLGAAALLILGVFWGRTRERQGMQRKIWKRPVMVAEERLAQKAEITLPVISRDDVAPLVLWDSDELLRFNSTGFDDERSTPLQPHEEAKVRKSIANFKNLLQSLGPVPKIIHLSWKQSINLTSQEFLIQYGIAALQRLNPAWVIELSTDDEVEDYLQTHMSAADWALLKPRHVVEKTDLWRLLKLYYTGGVYVDLDRLHSSPLDSLLTSSETKMALPLCGLGNFEDPNYMSQVRDFSQDFMLSAPGNPLYKHAAAVNTRERADQGVNMSTVLSTEALGAKGWLHTVASDVFGLALDSMWSVSVTAQMRAFVELLEPEVVSKVENLPWVGITFDYADGNNTAWQRQEARDMYTFEEVYIQAKKNFYEHGGVHHWTDMEKAKDQHGGQ